MRTSDCTLDTLLTDLAVDGSIYDGLDTIPDDLIPIAIYGDEWGMALDQVMRAYGEKATIRDLRDAMD